MNIIDEIDDSYEQLPDEDEATTLSDDLADDGDLTDDDEDLTDADLADDDDLNDDDDD